MDWKVIPPVWKSCFELAWEAHLEGSNPIAALVVDSDENIVSKGKSATRGNITDTPSAHCEIAHAEVNALLGLDNRIHDKQAAKAYTLYVTLEPCPLCFSALYMSDVSKLIFAARDRFGGSTNLLGKTPYLSRKPTTVQGPIEFLGELSIFLNVYSDIQRGIGAPDAVHEAFAKDYPSTVKEAYRLAPNDSLRIATQPDFEVVYFAIAEVLRA